MLTPEQMAEMYSPKSIEWLRERGKASDSFKIEHFDAVLTSHVALRTENEKLKAEIARLKGGRGQFKRFSDIRRHAEVGGSISKKEAMILFAELDRFWAREEELRKLSEGFSPETIAEFKRQEADDADR